MTTAPELVGAFLLAATLLTAAMFLMALQLGHLITRDDEQRAVEAARAPRMGVHDLVTTKACSRRAILTDGVVRRGAEPWKRLAERVISELAGTM